MKRVVRAFELHALDRPDARSFQPRVEDSIASESRDGERRGGDSRVFRHAPRARLLRRQSPRRRRAMHDDGRRVCLRAFERASATFRILRRDGPRANRRSEVFFASSLPHSRPRRGRRRARSRNEPDHRANADFRRARRLCSRARCRLSRLFHSTSATSRHPRNANRRDASCLCRAATRRSASRRRLYSVLARHPPTRPTRRRLNREPNRRGFRANRRDAIDPR